VLSGGGAILEGLPEIAEQIFDLPIRRGCPTGVSGLVDHVNSPAFAVAVGLALYAHRNRPESPARRSSFGPVSRVVGRLGRVFREFF
jgi:cell division protein FtsA